MVTRRSQAIAADKLPGLPPDEAEQEGGEDVFALLLKCGELLEQQQENGKQPAETGAAPAEAQAREAAAAAAANEEALGAAADEEAAQGAGGAPATAAGEEQAGPGAAAAIVAAVAAAGGDPGAAETLMALGLTAAATAAAGGGGDGSSSGDSTATSVGMGAAPSRRPSQDSVSSGAEQQRQWQHWQQQPALMAADLERLWKQAMQQGPTMHQQQQQQQHHLWQQLGAGEEQQQGQEEEEEEEDEAAARLGRRRRAAKRARREDMAEGSELEEEEALLGLCRGGGGGGSGGGGRKKKQAREKAPKMPKKERKYASNELSVEVLEAEGCFNMRLDDAARHLGFGSPTSIKKAMARLNIIKWPNRTRETAKNILAGLEEYLLRFFDAPTMEAAMARARVRLEPYLVCITALELADDLRKVRQKVYKLKDQDSDSAYTEANMRRCVERLLEDVMSEEFERGPGAPPAPAAAGTVAAGAGTAARAKEAAGEAGGGSGRGAARAGVAGEAGEGAPA